jgi:Mrp family chromosome partitioning ATPase
VKSNVWPATSSAGGAARKVTVLGTAPSESITLTALTLARLMARHAKVAVVDLAASSPIISAVSVDPAAPGLAELMLGEASFAQIITRTGCRASISSVPDVRALIARCYCRRG